MVEAPGIEPGARGEHQDRDARAQAATPPGPRSRWMGGARALLDDLEDTRDFGTRHGDARWHRDVGWRLEDCAAITAGRIGRLQWRSTAWAA